MQFSVALLDKLRSVSSPNRRLLVVPVYKKKKLYRLQSTAES